MANTPADRAPLSFSQVVLHGSAGPLREYLTEICAAQNKCATCWFHEDAGIAAGEGAVERAAEKLHLRHQDEHLVASDDLVALLREHAADAAERGLGTIESVRPVISASFAVQYSAFTESHDREIQDLLHDLPPSLRLDGETRDMRLDPRAKGIEAYSPAHDYEVHGGCRISGRVDLVIAKRKQLSDHELIKPAKIELLLG